MKKTRIDKIKAMTAEQFAEYLQEIVIDLFEDGVPPKEVIIEYLKQTDEI